MAKQKLYKKKKTSSRCLQTSVLAGALLAGTMPGITYAESMAPLNPAASASFAAGSSTTGAGLQNGFTDLDGISKSKQDSINEAVRKGLLHGDDAGHFRPEDTLTRQELAVLLARVLNLPQSDDHPSTFTDVPGSSWAAPFIEAVQKAGLMTGNGIGAFRPTDTISREELAAVFVRAVNGVGARGGDKPQVMDEKQVSSWAADSVDTALRLGLIDTNDSKLSPKGLVKREDIASFLIDIFQSGEQTATISSVDGDVVTVNGKPFLIAGQLKQLLGDRNADALQGAVLKYNSSNRNLNDLSALEIVKDGARLDMNGTSFAGNLTISGNGVELNGDTLEHVIVSPGVTQLTVNANIHTLQVNEPGEKLTLRGEANIENILLPDNIKLSQVIANLDAVTNQIKQVNTGIDDRNKTSPPVIPVNPNHAPTIKNQLTPVTAFAVDGDVTRSLADAFQDQDGNPLTFHAQSLNTSIANVQIDGTNLIVSPVSAGTTTINLSATDSHGAVSGTMQLSVTFKENHAPTVAILLTPVQTRFVDGDVSRSILGTFQDEESDTMTYTAESSDTSVATVDVNGTDLVITPVGAGTTTINITATDSHGAASEPVQLSVTFTANHAPAADVSLTAVNAKITDGNVTKSLSGAFQDEDGDTMTYAAESSNTNVATVDVNGTDLVIAPVSAGTTTINITATDSHGAASEPVQLSVTFTANHAPAADVSLTAVSASATEVNVTKSLVGAFHDEDGDTMTYAAESSDTSVATVDVNGTDLVITPVGAGTTTINITATDSHGAASELVSLSVTFTANHAPAADVPLTAVNAKITDGNVTKSLAAAFEDADNDSMTYAAESSDTSVATVDVNGTDLVITPVGAGTTTITITATDSHSAASEPIPLSVTITPPVSNNHPPVLNPSFSPVSTIEAAGDYTQSLADAFEDPDGDDMTIEASSSDTSVATVTVTGTDLVITPRNEGTVTITLTATDSGQEQETRSFQVTVTAATPRSMFFSELIWGDENLRMIEIYNPTSETLDASKLTIERSDLADPITISEDSGATIESGGTFVIGESWFFGDDGGRAIYYTEMNFIDDSQPIYLTLKYDGQVLDTAKYVPNQSLIRTPSLTHGNGGVEDDSQWTEEQSNSLENLGSYGIE